MEIVSCRLLVARDAATVAISLVPGPNWDQRLTLRRRRGRHLVAQAGEARAPAPRGAIMPTNSVYQTRGAIAATSG